MAVWPLGAATLWFEFWSSQPRYSHPVVCIFVPYRLRAPNPGQGARVSTQSAQSPRKCLKPLAHDWAEGPKPQPRPDQPTGLQVRADTSSRNGPGQEQAERTCELEVHRDRSRKRGPPEIEEGSVRQPLPGPASLTNLRGCRRRGPEQTLGDRVAGSVRQP